MYVEKKNVLNNRDSYFKFKKFFLIQHIYYHEEVLIDVEYFLSKFQTPLSQMVIERVTH